MKRTLLIFLLFFSFFVSADDAKKSITPVDITGGFGYNLGDDVSSLRLNSSWVNCKIPYRNFTKCFLEITLDKKITMIKGESSYQSLEDAQKEFYYIFEQLEKKYKCKFSDESKNYRANVISFSAEKKNCSITLLLDVDAKTIRIFYIDQELRKENNLKLEIREKELRLQQQKNEQQRNNNLDAI